MTSATGGTDATGDANAATHATAHVVGIVRGREIDARAEVELDGPTLVIFWSRATPWRLSLEGIDGVSVGDGQLTLYLANGDVLDLSGDHALRALGLQLMDRASAIPELTRGLRSLGMVMAIGSTCGMIASVIVLPALLVWLERGGKQVAE